MPMDIRTAAATRSDRAPGGVRKLSPEFLIRMSEVTPDAAQTDFTALGPNEWLVAAVPFSDAEIGFSAGLVDDSLSDYLGSPLGDPVFIIERSTWWEGQAITYVKLTYRPGHRLTTRY